MSQNPPSTDPRRIADHVQSLSGLQWKLLSFFLVIGVVGLGGAVWSRANPTHAAQVPKIAANTNGFANDTTAEEPAESERATLTWAEWFSNKGARLGFGFVGGFVVGFIFRVFIKLTTAVVAAVVLLLGALSYFNILNVDLSAVQTAVHSNAEWLTTQAWHLKILIVEHLPSTSTGTAGAFVGMRRR